MAGVSVEEKAALWEGIPGESVEDEAQRDYVDSDGTRCPYCGEKNIEVECILEFDLATVERDILCLDCQLREWTEAYSDVFKEK